MKNFLNFLLGLVTSTKSLKVIVIVSIIALVAFLCIGCSVSRNSVVNSENTTIATDQPVNVETDSLTIFNPLK